MCDNSGYTTWSRPGAVLVFVFCAPRSSCGANGVSSVEGVAHALRTASSRAGLCVSSACCISCGSVCGAARETNKLISQSALVLGQGTGGGFSFRFPATLRSHCQISLVDVVADISWHQSNHASVLRFCSCSFPLLDTSLSVARLWLLRCLRNAFFAWFIWCFIFATTGE